MAHVGFNEGSQSLAASAKGPWTEKMDGDAKAVLKVVIIIALLMSVGWLGWKSIT